MTGQEYRPHQYGEKKKNKKENGGIVLGYIAPANQYIFSFVFLSVFVDFLSGQNIGRRWSYWNFVGVTIQNWRHHKEVAKRLGTVGPKGRTGVRGR